MNVVTSAQIHAPKLKVEPPLWAMAFFWAVSLAVLAALSQLPEAGATLRYSLAIGWAFVMLGVLRNQVKGDFLVTMQANTEGLYFQAGVAHRYLFVPWKNVGRIEKACFPLNTRGLKVEITGESDAIIKEAKDVANVRGEDGCTFIYTIPQLRNRDKLIEELEYFRKIASNVRCDSV